MLLKWNYRQMVIKQSAAMTVRSLAKIRDATVCPFLINMPIISGLDVCRRLRDGSSLPVIMITARDEMTTKLPHWNLERMTSSPSHSTFVKFWAEALVRRSSPTTSDVITAKKPSLNCAERRCTYHGQDISLTVREFDLLECFMRNPRQALSRGQLIQNVWGEDYFGDDNVVDVYVRYLRKKLESTHPDRIIQTVRGIGFALRFAPVE